MRILGAIIAGGKSTRFGRDKALEEVDGKALIDAVVAALRGQTDEVVICGREWQDLTQLKDRPAANLGPLGGINAALHCALTHSFDGVLTMPVDVHPAPTGIAQQFAGEALTVFEQQHLIGFWPASLAKLLNSYLDEGNRSVHGFLDRIGARRIADPSGLTNINRPQDIERLRR